MEPDQTFQQWLAKRIDDVDDKIDSGIKEVKTELQETRHAQKGSLETLTLQVTELVGAHGRTNRDVEALYKWKEEGGPLDQRFHRHSARLDNLESWRSSIRGALVVVGLAVPILTGVSVAFANKFAGV